MKASESKKIGNTSFRVDSIKKMTLKQFEGTYSKILKGQDLKEVYNEITGGKPVEVKPEKGTDIEK